MIKVSWSHLLSDHNKLRCNVLQNRSHGAGFCIWKHHPLIYLLALLTSFLAVVVELCGALAAWLDSLNSLYSAMTISFISWKP